MKERSCELPLLPLPLVSNQSELKSSLKLGKDYLRRDKIKILSKDKKPPDLIIQSLFLIRRFYEFLEKFYPSCPKCSKKMFPNFCGIYACSCTQTNSRIFGL